jgi:PAS domain S-box-containing protein
MALNTAIAFLVLSVALFLSHTDSGLLAILAGSSPAGTMTRRLLPAAVLVPAGFGWLELHGELAGFFDSALGNAVFATGNILVFTVLICWSAKVLSRADIERAQADETLHRQETEVQVLFDLIPAMIWFKDTKNGILRINKRVAEAIGKSVEEIEGTSSPERYYADDLEVIRSGMPKLGIIETIRNLAGQESWVETDKVPYRDKDGKIVGIVVLAHDITGRKQTDEMVMRLASIVENSSEAIIGKTLTRQDLDRHHHQLESRGGENVRLHRIGNHRPVGTGAHSPGSAQGGIPDTGRLCQRRTRPAF